MPEATMNGKQRNLIFSYIVGLEILYLNPQGKFCLLLQLIFRNLSIKRTAAEFSLQQKIRYSANLDPQSEPGPHGVHGAVRGCLWR
jgi:hypothetical protein